MRLRCKLGFHKWIYIGRFGLDERECKFCKKKQEIKTNGIWGDKNKPKTPWRLND